MRDELAEYVVRLLQATRNDPSLALGASPRAGVAILRAAKASACIQNRNYANPEDVKRVLLPALRHRVILDPRAEVEGRGWTRSSAPSRTGSPRRDSWDSMLLPTPRLAALLIGAAAVFAVGVVVDAARFLGIWIDVALAAAALADAALCPRRRQFEMTRAAPRGSGGEGLAVETTIRRKLGFLETLLDRREDAPPSFIPAAAAGSPAGSTRVRPGESLVLRSLWTPAERGRSF